MGSHITKVIHGVTYSKFKFDDQPEYGPFWMPPHDHGEGSKAPLICDCGSNRFVISFGSYEVWAECAQCAAQQVVYDG